MSIPPIPVTESFFRTGDKAAFESMFRSYYSRLVMYARKILGDQDEAEEMVQQLFVNIWEARNEMKEPNSLQSYLYRSVYNRCLNKLEKEKVRNNYREEVKAVGGEVVQPVESLQHSELQREMNRAVNKLPEQCRRVFELSRYEGLKYAAIAEVMGISVKTVENQMSKALKVLRNELKDYLVTFLLLLLINYLRN